MLKTNKSISLTGESIIEGVQVVYMMANISTNGSNNGTTTKTITNKDLYKTNLTAVRDDMDAFDKEVYAIEDGLVGGTV